MGCWIGKDHASVKGFVHCHGPLQRRLSLPDRPAPLPTASLVAVIHKIGVCPRRSVQSWANNPSAVAYHNGAGSDRGLNTTQLLCLVPLYKTLAMTPDGKAWAINVYKKARPGYHPLAQGTVDDILK